MILETSQNIQLGTHLPYQSALHFIQSPKVLLSYLDFLQDLQQVDAQLSGVLALHFPMLGKVTLPFCSQIQSLPQGAILTAQPIEDERAWLEIMGQGKVTSTEGLLQLDYQFQFRAHLQTPPAEQWGNRAFEKMVQASAQRSILRVSQALPHALQQALSEYEQEQLTATTQDKS